MNSIKKKIQNKKRKFFFKKKKRCRDNNLCDNYNKEGYKANKYKKNFNKRKLWEGSKKKVAIIEIKEFAPLELDQE